MPVREPGVRRSASSSSGAVRDVASQFRATSNQRLKRVRRGGFDTEDPRTGEWQSRRTFTVGGGARRSSSMVGLNGTQQQQQHAGFAQQQHAAAPVPPPRIKRAARSVESSSRARPSSIPRPLHQHQHPRQQVIPPVAAVQPRDPRQVAQQQQQRHQRQVVRPRPPPPALSRRFTTRTEDRSRESRKKYPTSSSSSSSSPANASKRVPKRLPPTPYTTAEATKRGGRGGGGGSGLQLGRRRGAEETGIGFVGEPAARVRVGGVRESRRPDWPPQQRRGGGGGRPSQNEGRGKRESEEEEAEAAFFPNPLPRPPPPPPQVLLLPKLDCGGAASSRENEEESGKRRGKLYGEREVRGAVLLPRPPEITERRRTEAGKVFSGREGEGGGDRRRPVAGRRGEEEEDGRDYCLVPGEEDENSQEEEERSAKVALAGPEEEEEEESNNHESCGGTVRSPPMEQTPSPLAAEGSRIGESRVFSENFGFSTCATQTQLIPNNDLGATFKKGSEGNGVGASVLEEERSRNVIVHDWDEERQKSPLDEYFKLSFSSEQQSDGELRRSI